MRALLQRVRQANVSINGSVHSAIKQGLLIFLGVAHQDTAQYSLELARRCSDLRIFEDNEGKMNLSVKDVGGSVLVVSQFTLYADTSRGNRPSFTEAARPEEAEKLYEDFVKALRAELGEPRVCTGIFREMMDINLINDGPVTIMLENKKSV